MKKDPLNLITKPGNNTLKHSADRTPILSTLSTRNSNETAIGTLLPRLQMNNLELSQHDLTFS